MRIKQHVTLVAQPPPSAGTLSQSLQSSLEAKSSHPDQNYGSSLGGGLIRLSYIILDNHISHIQGLHLLGRLIQNIRRPLDNYVPSAKTSAAAFPTEQHDLREPNWQSTESRSSTLSSTSTFIDSSTAQGLFPAVDREVFVLPDLPLSHSESNSATFSQTYSYSAQTQSLFTALLGLSLSSSNNSSRTFNLKAKVIHTISVAQHAQVFETLMRIHGREIKQKVKRSGGVMFFVIGVKIAKDAVVETREEGGRSIGGKMELDTASALGIRSASSMRHVASVVGGHSRLREWENTSVEEVKGARAFAMEYCSVKLQRKVDFSGGASRSKTVRELASEAKRMLQCEFPPSRKGRMLDIGSRQTAAGHFIPVFESDVAKLKMKKGDVVWQREMRYKWLQELVDRAERLNDPSTTPGKDKDSARLEQEIVQEQKDLQRLWYANESAKEQNESMQWHLTEVANRPDGINYHDTVPTFSGPEPPTASPKSDSARGVVCPPLCRLSRMIDRSGSLPPAIGRTKVFFPTSEPADIFQPSIIDDSDLITFEDISIEDSSTDPGIDDDDDSDDGDEDDDDHYEISLGDEVFTEIFDSIPDL